MPLILLRDRTAPKFDLTFLVDHQLYKFGSNATLQDSTPVGTTANRMVDPGQGA